MPENLALNLGDSGLGGLSGLIPLAMQRLSRGASPEPEGAAAAAKTNGAEPPAPPSA
jgi:hypothetical protein